MKDPFPIHQPCHALLVRPPACPCANLSGVKGVRKDLTERPEGALLPAPKPAALGQLKRPCPPCFTSAPRASAGHTFGGGRRRAGPEPLPTGCRQEASSQTAPGMLLSGPRNIFHCRKLPCFPDFQGKHRPRRGSCHSYQQQWGRRCCSLPALAPSPPGRVPARQGLRHAPSPTASALGALAPSPQSKGKI